MKDRLIGLDVGDKTIGVAVSDPLMITAQGVTTIERIGARKDCDKIIGYIKEYDAKTVVCGLPLMLDGTDSPQTEKVRAFAELLQNKMRSSAIKAELVFMDERFTTKIAESVMMETGMKRKERKEFVDKQAAVIILQSYIDKLHFKERNDG
jgi:putative Holliday junction resolvase